MNAVFDGIDKFLVFFGRVGIVKTQMASSLIVFRQTEIQADGFGMPDMQVTIGFWRETGDDLRHPRTLVSAFLKVGINDGPQEIGWRGWNGTAVFIVCAHNMT